MSDLYWLTDEQMARFRPYFSKSHGKPRVDDRQVLGRIIFVNRNKPRWCEVPKKFVSHKTLCNRRKRSGRDGRLPAHDGRAGRRGADPKTVMFDVTYLKAHCMASSLRVKKGISHRLISRTKGGMFGRLKDCRRVATSYDQCPTIFCFANAHRRRHLLALVN